MRKRDHTSRSHPRGTQRHGPVSGARTGAHRPGASAGSGAGAPIAPGHRHHVDRSPATGSAGRAGADTAAGSVAGHGHAAEATGRWSHQHGWGMLFIRYGIGIILVVAGVILLIVDPGGFGVDGFGMSAGSGFSVLMLNFLYRFGVTGDQERQREEEARRYLAEHGHWPD